MARELSAQVVVITGASSGIGRAVALSFGRAGTKVVLAARTEEALEDVAREIREAGGEALVVPTDVGDFAQVQALADRAVSHFGRVDTWVNDAAAAAYIPIKDMAVEEFEQVIRVVLLGTVYGVKAILPHMLARDEGTIINIESVLAELSVPLQGAYCAAKHGVRGFTNSLRQELAHDHSKVNVTAILPTSINTPYFEHARARNGGKAPMGLPPAYPPEAVARAVVFAAQNPRRDIVVGGAGKFFLLMNRVSQSFTDGFIRFGDMGYRGQTREIPDDGRDNLFEPLPGPKPMEGRQPLTFPDLYTRYLELHPQRKRALSLALMVGAYALMRRPRRA